MELQKIETAVHSAIIRQVFGRLDENIKKIEKAFGCSVVNRGDAVVITGDKAERARAVLDKLAEQAARGEEIQEQTVNYLIASVEDAGFGEIDAISSDSVCATMSGRVIKPKTLGQKRYIDKIRKNTLVFSVGPAGTGKTYLAMAMAITAFKNGEVSRIILTRPAIEAGEKLGFLPGDLQQKVDPYLRPLHDALYEIMGPESFHRNQERGAIEVAPLAYMRGRTLDNSFIVLDEAQNTTAEQMKMFLTRIGFGAKAVITGDITQIDLPEGKRSGLVEAVSILEGIEGIGVCMLTNKDVVRHPLVQKIIEAYDKQSPAKRRGSRNKRETRQGRRRL
jgi:phosphate starvation-inducible PhoH-like protein